MYLCLVWLGWVRLGGGRGDHDDAKEKPSLIFNVRC